MFVLVVDYSKFGPSLKSDVFPNYSLVYPLGLFDHSPPVRNRFGICKAARIGTSTPHE